MEFGNLGITRMLNCHSQRNQKGGKKESFVQQKFRPQDLEDNEQFLPAQLWPHQHP